MRVVQPAANIIREDIRSYTYDTNNYTLNASLQEDANIPVTLKTVMSCILTTKSKCNKNIKQKRLAISQAIISACRPKSFTPSLLLHIGIYIHGHLESKQAIDLLHSLGFSSSYFEIKRFKVSIMNSLWTTPKGVVFDNADFNIRFVDRHRTFHNMAGITCGSH